MNSKFTEYLDMSEFRKDPVLSEIPTEPHLLIGGDFSGIQKYIYKIASAHAARSLKGRSFYLHLLSDAIVRFLLKELELDQNSKVYDSGGSFYLVAPDTPQIRSKVETAALEIEKHLFNAHGTDLYLALDYVPLPVEAITHSNGQDLRQVWTALFNRRRLQKNCRFSRLLKSQPDLFFEPVMNGGDFKRDCVTGEELPKGTKPDKNGNFYSPITAIQIEIGAALYKYDCCYVTESPIDNWDNMTWVCPAGLGSCYYFANKSDQEELKQLAGGAEFETVPIQGSVKWLRTFEDITKGSSDDESFERLGVLRMDVDNLGMLFQQGIPAESATLQRYSALSHKFDYFFGQHLHTLINPERSIIIYSGGDDIFAVGAWDETIRLAKRIREDFREYTKGDSSFSISGGIAILKAKYPIMKGAAESAEEEDAAKEHSVTTAGGKKLTKNSISFMDMPLNWDVEFPAVEGLKDKLLELLSEGAINKSFLGKVMKHAANAGIKDRLTKKNDHIVKNFRTFWLLTYDLSRMSQNAHSQAGKEIINLCINEVCGGGKNLNGRKIETDYHPLELWQMACRWAELEYRTND